MHAKVTRAREVAYDAFVEVMEHQQKPDAAMEELCRQSKLTRLDRNFAKEVLYGGLRWFSKIFWIVEKTAKRDLGKSSPEIRAALVLGTYQIFYMDRVPDRAAVNESVEYIKKKGQKKAVNFVNGVLRSIARRSEYFAKPDKDKKPLEYLALQYAHPSWMVMRWSQRFAFEHVRGILVSNNQPPPYHIRVNSTKVAQDYFQEFRTRLLREEKVHSDRRPLRCCMVLKESPVFDKESLFDQGFYTVQGEASQLVGSLVAPQPGDIVVDACAGPGGKASHLSEMSHGKKIALHVVEKDPSRLELVKQTFSRLGLNDAHWFAGDFREFSLSSGVDRILIDAPCSGLGVVRRHPEGKWQKKPSIVRHMAVIQRELLAHGLGLLKPGGELIFSVCSFEAAETTDHITWLEEEFGDTIEVVPVGSRIPDYYKRFVTKEQCLLIYSGNKDGMDGFGAFIVRKRSVEL